MIKKTGSKYIVLSETTGRRMGSYDTKKEALNRLRQIEYFKHLKPTRNAEKNRKMRNRLRYR